MAAAMDADEEGADFVVSAVLPAAGSGVRMEMDTPKQFCRILGRPLISYTLEAFERVPWIQEIVVATSQDRFQFMTDVLKEFKHKRVRLTLGGTTRHRSIFNGIESLTFEGRASPDVVIIHDAVRPFVRESILKEVALAARKYGAAGAIRPLVSTVISKSEEGFLDQSLDRSRYRTSEMPQAFQYNVINNAYNKCTEYDFEHGTECLHLASTYSATKARLIDGPSSLWKVTHKKDLYAVEAMLKENQSEKVVLIGSKNGDIEQHLTAEMTKQNNQVICLSTHTDVQDARADMSTATVVCNIVRCHISAKRDQVMDDETSADFTHSREALERISSFDSCGRKAIVTTVISFDDSDADKLKRFTQDLHKQGLKAGVCCFGIFIHVKEQGQLPILERSRVREIITETALNTKAIYSGQTFQLDCR